MRHYEELESRKLLAATIWDTNPGPYSSDVAPIRQVDDWLYLDATVGEERRLIKTDGQSVVDVGPALAVTDSFIRDNTLIGTTDTGVVQFDFATDTLSAVSDEPGGKVLNGETVYWYTRVMTDVSQTPEDELYHIVTNYHDLEGRSVAWDETVRFYDSAFGFNPLDVVGDTLVAKGSPRASFDLELFLIRDGQVVPVLDGAGEHLELGGQLYFRRGSDYITEAGDVAFAAPDQLHDFPGGAWLITGSVISRLDDTGQVQLIGDLAAAEWNPAMYGAPIYWDADRLIVYGKSDLWGAEPYVVTDTIQFMGNFGFGPGGSSHYHVRALGTYELFSTGSDSWRLLTSNKFIPIATPVEPLLLTDNAYVTLEYTEATGTELVRHDLFPGDANLDGIFDSGDLVHLFQLGEYEDQLVGNSSRVTGDFDGDGDFTSGDIVLAFQAGQYAG
jgi:hypothetical protein